MKLRPYQQDTIFHLINSQFERECVCLPTGSGKTFIFSILCGLLVQKNERIIIAVHRAELMEQAAKQIFNETGIKPDLVVANTKITPTAPIVLCMVETLFRRKKTLQLLSQIYSVLIVDECHIGNFNKILPFFKRIIGFSATPINIKKRESLADHYKELYIPLQINDLIPEFLCTPEFWGHPGALDHKHFKLNASGTDYDEKYMGDMLSAPKFIEVTASYVEKFAKGKKTIIYNSSIKHSLILTAHLKSLGFNCHHLDGETKTDERKAILAKLYTEHDCIISNVGVLTTGFDCPEVEVIILNRLTKSLALFIQMAGRGSRISSLIPKEKFFIIDLCNNFKIHGLWNDDRHWDKLFRKEKTNEGAQPLKMCPKCGFLAHLNLSNCPQCDHLFLTNKHNDPEKDPLLIKFEFHKKEMNLIMESIQIRGNNIYRGLHLMKEKIYQPNVPLEILQQQLLSQLPIWCKQTGKKNNQWNKDFCNNIMKEYFQLKNKL